MGWACDLIPKELLITRCFGEEQAAVDQLAAELETVAARLSELEEEHGAEEAAFAGFDKVNKGQVTARLKEIKGDADSLDEAAVLNDWLTCSTQEAALKKRVSDADAILDAQALAHYPNLTPTDIQTLTVDNKWLAALDAAIQGEMERVSQELTGRVTELAERYEMPMPEMVVRVVELEARVAKHLETMGFAW